MSYLIKLLPMLAIIILVSSCKTKDGITLRKSDGEINTVEDAINDLKALQEDTDKDEATKKTERDTLILALESTANTATSNIAAIIVKLKALQVDAGKTAEEKIAEHAALIKELELIVTGDENAAVAAIIAKLRKLQVDTDKPITTKEVERLALIKELELTRKLNKQIDGDLIAIGESPDIEWFKPKMAVNIRYFKDTGSDDTGEIDVFSDGNSIIALTAVIDLVRLRNVKIYKIDAYFPVEFGINVGLGVGPANIVDDTENKTAAALLGTIGGFVDFYRNNGATCIGGLEFGYAYGYTFVESFTPGKNDDSAWYIGYSYKFTF